ncbi:MAG: serine/threonine protein kinase [Phycisphaerales bacterium]|nr:serine/threonine protein kinase [Phycisphaerales bacterium]
MVSTPPNDDSRERDLAQAMERIAQQLSCGENITPAELERLYPHLMPELAARVQDLKTMIAADLALAAKSPLDNPHAKYRSMLEELQSTLDGYQILEVIHAGGQGVVLHALQQSTKRNVAIKVLLDGPLANARRMRRFAREIRITSQLQLPNIVQVFDSGVVKGYQYFVMQYVDGIPLDDYALLHDLSARMRVALFVKIARAVSRAHQRGIIHRDLKPSNILVDPDGEPQILDFGLAKAMSAAMEVDGDDDISMVGNVVGTLPYISPEQAIGVDEVDVRSDAYSLGVVLFELLTGNYPYDVTGQRDHVRSRIINAKPRRLKDTVPSGDWTGLPSGNELDEDLEAIVARALAKDCEDRYQSVAAFADDLDLYLVGGIVQARINQRWYLARRMMRQYRLQLTATMIILVLLAGAVAVSTSFWMQARDQRDSARQIASLAQSTLGRVVSEVNEEIEALAGGKVVRKRLLNDTSASLTKLTELVGTDTALRGISVSLLEKQGDIAYSDGRKKDAVQLFRQAIHQLAGAENAASDVDLARLHRKVANAVEDGAEEFVSALRYARTASDSELPGADAELTRTLVDMTRAEFLKGEYVTALGRLQEALQLLSSSDDKQLLAEALEWNGDTLYKLGHPNQACASLERCLAIRAQLLAESSFDVRLRYDHMIASTKLSSMLAKLGEYDRAIKNARVAAETADYLYHVDIGNPEYRRDYISTMVRHAIVLRESGDVSGALDAVALAVRQANAFVASDWDDTQLRRQLGFALRDRAKCYWARKNYAAALKDAIASLAIHTTLSEAEPNNLEYLDELAVAHEAVSRSLQHMDRPAEAYDHLLAARQIHQRLLELQPDVPDRTLRLVVSVINLAVWHMKQSTRRDDESAQTLLDLAEKRLRALGKATPTVRTLPVFESYLKAIDAYQSQLDRRRHTSQQEAHRKGTELPQARSRLPRSALQMRCAQMNASIPRRDRCTCQTVPV